jgi:hypothetical membrane protein
MEFDIVAKKKMMMVAWVCGILASIVVLSSVLAAISQSPWFSWTANALSDLGVSGAASIFNSGLIVGGILMMVFAAGLLVVSGRALERAGAALLFIGAIALSCIGVFTESAGDIHTYVAVAFFGISALSFFLIGAGLMVAGSKKFGLLTVLAGILVGVPWAFVSTWSGLAIPETLSAVVIFIWVIAEGAKLCISK